MTTLHDPEREERERLATLPGLTKAQRDALRDPTFSMRMCRLLVDALRAQAAAKFEAKPESEKAMARAFGQVEHVSINDGASFGGQLREVSRG